MEPLEPVAISSDNNLFVRLYRLAHRQQENFTTESFVHVLRHLIKHEPQAAAKFLNWLTDSSIFSQLRVEFSELVCTQVHSPEGSVPDIRIQNDNIDLIVEVKLDGCLSFEQAHAYAELLANSGRPQQKLVALTGYEPNSQLPPKTVVRTWGDVGVSLKQAAQDADSVTNYLIEQLCGFLNFLNLMPIRICSPLSEALRDHQRWADANPKIPALSHHNPRRIKSFTSLSELPHLEPLRNLLLQMEMVLQQSADTRYALDTGMMGSPPWIGFILNNLEYFFYISLKQPEHVIFQQYKHPIAPETFDGSMGQLVNPRSTKGYRWENTLNLLDHSGQFFQMNENEQRQTLQNFFICSLSFAQKLQAQQAQVGEHKQGPQKCDL